MNIALVHDWLTNFAGAERVLLDLAELFPGSRIYTSVYDRKKVPQFAKYDVVESYLGKNPVFKRYREALIPYAPQAFESFDFSNYDLVISNTTFAAKGIIVKPKTLHICYCHTPARYLWQPEIDDRADTGIFSSLRKKIAHNLKIWDRAAAERPDYYLANSNTVKKRIKKYYNRDSVVVYPPVDTDRFSICPRSEVKDYFLFVSRLVGYKKADIVIDAFNRLKKPLYIIGSGPDEARLRRVASKNIKFLGRVSDAELSDYYQKAQALVFIAEEDFGIVPLESSSSGRPVIAYNAGGASETVVPGINGILINEQSSQALVEAVSRFKADQFNPEAVRTHAEKFSKKIFRQNFKTEVDKLLGKWK